jgi:hypothetical protein
MFQVQLKTTTMLKSEPQQQRGIEDLPFPLPLQHCKGKTAIVGPLVAQQGKCKPVLSDAHLILPPLLCSCIVSTARGCSCRHNLLAPHSTCSRTSG